MLGNDELLDGLVPALTTLTLSAAFLAAVFYFTGEKILDQPSQMMKPITLESCGHQPCIDMRKP